MNYLGTLAFLVYKMDELFRIFINHPMGLLIFLQLVIICILYPFQVLDLMIKIASFPINKLRLIYLDEFPVDRNSSGNET